MRKIMLLVCLICSLLVSATCFAKVKPADFQINGLAIGDSAAKLFKTCGNPVSVDIIEVTRKIWNYGKDGTILNFRVMNDSVVEGISSVGDTGISTVGGISYGSSLASVKKVYGKPDWEGEVEVRYGAGIYGKYGLDYSCVDKGQTYALHFGFENGKVHGFYLQRDTEG